MKPGTIASGRPLPAHSAPVTLARGEESVTDEQIDALILSISRRRLDHLDIRHLEIEATYGSRRRMGGTRLAAVVTARGITANGRTELLGIATGDTGDGRFWLEFLHDLRSRGLSGVRFVVAREHSGLPEAVADMLPGAQWTYESSEASCPRAAALIPG